MQKTITLALLLACTALQPSCNQNTTPPAHQTPEPSNEAITALQAQVMELRAQLNGLQTEFETERNRYLSATLDPTEPSFQRVDATGSFGSFAVSVEDVRAFGDGVRLRMALGNLSSASYNGVIVTIKYGPRQPSDYSAPDWASREVAWTKSLQQKTVTLTDSLHPGHWNPVEITIPGIAVDRFGYLDVSLQTNNISLAK
jgi:hypothetical protein